MFLLMIIESLSLQLTVKYTDNLPRKRSFQKRGETFFCLQLLLNYYCVPCYLSYLL